MHLSDYTKALPKEKGCKMYGCITAYWIKSSDPIEFSLWPWHHWSFRKELGSFLLRLLPHQEQRDAVVWNVGGAEMMAACFFPPSSGWWWNKSLGFDCTHHPKMWLLFVRIISNICTWKTHTYTKKKKNFPGKSQRINFHLLSAVTLV